MKFIKFSAIALMLFMAYACGSDDNDLTPTFNPWGPTMKGDNQSIQAFPDMHANYWEYTFSVEKNPNIGLRIEGTYPDCRFFNFTIYDDLKDPNTPDNQDLASFEDINIKPDNGSVNPFVSESSQNNKYTIYVVPQGKSVTGENNANIMEFPTSIKHLSLFLRQYIGIDEFGGSELPKITAFDITTGKTIDMPKREISKIHDLNMLPGGSFPNAEKLIFFRAPFSMYYPNRPCQYLYARNQVESDQVMVFNFIAPTHPQNVSDYKTADVRYWSICIGDQYTFSYQSIYDQQAYNEKGKYTTFVIADKSAPEFEQIKAKCKRDKLNFMEWDMKDITPEGKERGAGIMILYRNTCIREGYEYSFEKMHALGQGDRPKPETHFAHLVLKEYGAYGMKMPNKFFLDVPSEQLHEMIRMQ